MAKVHFAPNSAIKYIGSKHKEFTSSLDRPKPMLKKGDIVIVDKRTSFNLVTKGFGEFIVVEDIEFVKADTKAVKELEDLKEQLAAFKNENNNLFSKNVELTKYISALPKLVEEQ